MTKKHFEAIAYIIKCQVDASPNKNGHTYHYDMAHELGLYFIQQNPRFDLMRFLVACGVVDERTK